MDKENTMTSKNDYQTPAIAVYLLNAEDVLMGSPLAEIQDEWGSGNDDTVF